MSSGRVMHAHGRLCVCVPLCYHVCRYSFIPKVRVGVGPMEFQLNHAQHMSTSLM